MLQRDVIRIGEQKLRLAWLLLKQIVATKVDGDRTGQTKESDLSECETKEKKRNR